MHDVSMLWAAMQQGSPYVMQSIYMYSDLGCCWQFGVVKVVGNEVHFWSSRAWQHHKDRTILTCQQEWKFITTNVLLSSFLVFKGLLNSKVTENCWQESESKDVSKGENVSVRSTRVDWQEIPPHGFTSLWDHAMCWLEKQTPFSDPAVMAAFPMVIHQEF